MMPSNRSDDTVINLTVADREKAVKLLQEIPSAVSYVIDCVKTEIKVSDRFNGMGAIHSKFTDVGKILGYENDIAQGRESLIQRIRELNNEVAELKKQLAGKITLEHAAQFFLQFDKEF